MSATAAAADFQADLYHLTSTAANETDKSKIKAIGERLAEPLGDRARDDDGSRDRRPIRAL